MSVAARSRVPNSNNNNANSKDEESQSLTLANNNTFNNQNNQNNLLDLVGVIGFNGGVRSGLILHPGDKHLIYPLGSTIVVRNLYTNTQTFLQKNGHDRQVSCLAISKTGKYLASGQVTHMGFSALVIIWNLETYSIVHKLVLHKGSISDLSFSPHEKYLVTLGGRDDNKIVVWDIESGEAICGATAANETAHTVRFFNHSDDYLVTGGNYNLRVWYLDLANRKVRPSDCQLGQMKRVITTLVIDEQDKFMYCGTMTGDLLQVSLGPNLFKNSGPVKKSFQLGITCVIRLTNGTIVVGAGDGTIALLKPDTLSIIKKTKVSGGVTSLSLNAAGDHFFAGTNKCNIYLVHATTLEYELRNTCHQGKIYDIAYPYRYSELFATCSATDIRIWNARTLNELLRIHVPNLTALCVTFSPDGRAILSGWDDGKIRAFAPQSGKLLYVINDAHIGGVTALATTSDCARIISGGEGGQVRVWACERGSVGVAGAHRMIASMKEHKARVNRIQITADDSECVSASSDGSCITWSLQRFVRNTCLFASTQFRAIVYHPDSSQLLTTGTDRKLTYWDVVDGNPIRIVDGSMTDVLNCLAISESGDKFVCGGGDKQVKLWAYDEGKCYYKGIGHSGEIVQCVVSPDQQHIVTCGEEGAIFIWRMPATNFNTDYQQNANTNANGNQLNSNNNNNYQQTALRELSKANPTPQELDESQNKQAQAQNINSLSTSLESTKLSNNNNINVTAVEAKDSESQQSTQLNSNNNNNANNNANPNGVARVTSSRGRYDSSAIQNAAVAARPKRTTGPLLRKTK